MLLIGCPAMAADMYTSLFTLPPSAPFQPTDTAVCAQFSARFAAYLRNVSSDHDSCIHRSHGRPEFGATCSAPECQSLHDARDTLSKRMSVEVGACYSAAQNAMKRASDLAAENRALEDKERERRRITREPLAEKDVRSSEQLRQSNLKAALARSDKDQFLAELSPSQRKAFLEAERKIVKEDAARRRAIDSPDQARAERRDRAEAAAKGSDGGIYVPDTRSAFERAASAYLDAKAKVDKAAAFVSAGRETVTGNPFDVAVNAAAQIPEQRMNKAIAEDPRMAYAGVFVEPAVAATKQVHEEAIDQLNRTFDNGSTNANPFAETPGSGMPPSASSSFARISEPNPFIDTSPTVGGQEAVLVSSSGDVYRLTEDQLLYRDPRTLELSVVRRDQIPAMESNITHQDVDTAKRCGKKGLGVVSLTCERKRQRELNPFGN